MRCAIHSRRIRPHTPPCGTRSSCARARSTRDPQLLHTRFMQRALHAVRVRGIMTFACAATTSSVDKIPVSDFLHGSRRGDEQVRASLRTPPPFAQSLLVVLPSLPSQPFCFCF